MITTGAETHIKIIFITSYVYLTKANWSIVFVAFSKQILLAAMADGFMVYYYEIERNEAVVLAYLLGRCGAQLNLHIQGIIKQKNSRSESLCEERSAAKASHDNEICC